MAMVSLSRQSLAAVTTTGRFLPMKTHTRVIIGLTIWLCLGMTALVYDLVNPNGVLAWLLAYIPALIFVIGAGIGIAVGIIGVLIGIATTPRG